MSLKLRLDFGRRQKCYSLLKPLHYIRTTTSFISGFPHNFVSLFYIPGFKTEQQVAKLFHRELVQRLVDPDLCAIHYVQ